MPRSAATFMAFNISSSGTGALLDRGSVPGATDDMIEVNDAEDEAEKANHPFDT